LEGLTARSVIKPLITKFLEVCKTENLNSNTFHLKESGKAIDGGGYPSSGFGDLAIGTSQLSDLGSRLTKDTQD